MMADPSHAGPWYQHGWPWFIVGLLGTTVVAGVVTVYIAFDGADPLVDDDYYRAGKAINQTFEAEHEAGLREVTARVSADKGVVIDLDLIGDAPLALELALSHATHAERDVLLRLQLDREGRYVSESPLPSGSFYATLQPAEEGATWRLRRRVILPGDGSFTLEPSG